MTSEENWASKTARSCVNDSKNRTSSNWGTVYAINGITYGLLAIAEEFRRFNDNNIIKKRRIKQI